MVAITLHQIAGAYDLASKIIAGHLTESHAIDKLVRKFGMNPVSASAYVYAYRHMRNGEVYKRKVNIECTRFYLENIQSDIGRDAALTALISVRLHIDYYEKVAGTYYKGLRQLADEFEKNIDTISVSEKTSFEVEVENLMSVSFAERSTMLPSSGHKPDIKVTSINIFKRNAAVAATVRVRANGVCENCRNPAPFIKKSNGVPFLEVHHVVRLADNGDDTVDNAIAVCPNCHRQLHYG